MSELVEIDFEFGRRAFCAGVFQWLINSFLHPLGPLAQTAREQPVGISFSLRYLFDCPHNMVQVRNYIFGYGSLICQHSRAVTVPEHANTLATPVVVSGLERVFAKRTNRGMTAMGVQFRENAECVGVILPVSEKDMKEFDKRERGYERLPLNLTNVDEVPFLNKTEHYRDPAHQVFLNAKSGTLKEKLQVWVYIQKDPLPPTQDHPIVQTYIDTILRGCLSINEEFAKEFIATTKGWSLEEIPELTTESESDDDSDTLSLQNEPIWVDDRHNPIYVRGDKKHSLENAGRFDSLLRKLRPRHFSRRIKQ